MIDSLKTKFLDSTVSNDVGGRVYYRKATDNEFPRIVYSIITGNPDNVFARKGENTLLQVDIFTADSAGDDFAKTVYTDLRALLDDWKVTVAGVGSYEFTWQNMVEVSEEVAVSDGTTGILHRAVDYEVTFQAA